jgi:putative phage-type endonuclease
LWRQKGLGSSDASVLSGHNPWRNIQQLWSEKVSGKSEIKENWAMQRGKELEPVARDIYEFQMGIECKPHTMCDEDNSAFKASFDGVNFEKQIVLEIKCPGKKDLEIAAKGFIPLKYYSQVQWLLMVSRLPLCHYVTYDGKDKISIVEVEASRGYQKALRKLGVWFLDKVNKKEHIYEYGVCLQVPKMHESKVWCD